MALSTMARKLAQLVQGPVIFIFGSETASKLTRFAPVGVHLTKVVVGALSLFYGTHDNTLNQVFYALPFVYGKLQYCPYSDKTQYVLAPNKLHDTLFYFMWNRNLWENDGQIVDPMNREYEGVLPVLTNIVQALSDGLRFQKDSKISVHLPYGYKRKGDECVERVIPARFGRTSSCLAFLPPWLCGAFGGPMGHMSAVILHLFELRLWDMMLYCGRRMEYEADYIGLLLMASAGYDPRCSPWFFKNEIHDDDICDLERNHPSPKKRADALSRSQIMDKAVKIYEEVKAGKGVRSFIPK